MTNKTFSTSPVTHLELNCRSEHSWRPSQTALPAQASRQRPLARTLAAGQIFVIGLLLLLCHSAAAQTPLPDDFNPGANGAVYSLAVQADGKILVGGDFTTLGGQTRNRIGRLNADGSLDPTFNPGASSGVRSLAVQTDGKILVGGNFTTLGGQTRNRIGRLNADGSLDTTFNPGADTVNPGADGVVHSLAVQADGKILVGGDFNWLGGQLRYRLGRLNADGSLDLSFTRPFLTSLFSGAVQTDGKILVGGFFMFSLLNADGTLDPTFNPGVNGTVTSLAVQPDGKILVGGGFNALGGQPRYCIGRLNADGTLDLTFNAMANYAPVSLLVQADGKILLGGAFYQLNAPYPYRDYIGRLNADGSLDTTFNPGANFIVHSLALQADGKILVGGSFTTLGGLPRAHIGRINNTDPATQNLTHDGSTITWLRGGSSPEVWRTTFDLTTNGSDWSTLGPGTRTSGGWELTKIALPSNCTIRARGFAAGGYGNGSAWFVETFLHSQPRLGINPSQDGQLTLRLFGNPGETVELQTATNLLGPWWSAQSLVLTNSTHALPWTNQPDTQRYFRMQPQ